MRLDNETRFRIGAAITVGSIVALFWWGIQFDVFGEKIDFAARPVEQLGFFSWMALGLFGIGFGLLGLRSGGCATIGFFSLLTAAYGVGLLLGNY